MAILDAILKKTIFRVSDFGKLLVCYKVHQTLLESVEKPFVAIFWGLRVFVPYIDLTIYLIHVIINELGKTNLQPEHLKGIHIFHITYHYPSSISFVCQFDMCVNLVDSNIYCPNY